MPDMLYFISLSQVVMASGLRLMAEPCQGAKKGVTVWAQYGEG